MDTEILAEIAEARRDAKKLADKEHSTRTGHEANFPWKIYSSNVDSYTYTFQSVLDAPFSDRVRESAIKGKPLVILDLMSDASFIRELSALGAKGLAVTLADTRSAEQIKEDLSAGIGVIGQNAEKTTPIGDILSNSTWKNIRNWLLFNREELGYSREFDISVIRPEAGIYVIPPNENLLYHLLNQVYSLTRDTIYTQIPQYLPKKIMEDYVQQLQETKGLEASLGWHETNHGNEQVLRITKLEDAPEILPPSDSYINSLNKLRSTVARKVIQGEILESRTDLEQPPEDI